MRSDQGHSAAEEDEWDDWKGKVCVREMQIPGPARQGAESTGKGKCSGRL